MRKNVNITEGIFPMPVLMVATYNEDGSVNVMNASWGLSAEPRVAKQAIMPPAPAGFKEQFDANHVFSHRGRTDFRCCDGFWLIASNIFRCTQSSSSKLIR